jgi:hypothetical protein
MVASSPKVSDIVEKGRCDGQVPVVGRQMQQRAERVEKGRGESRAPFCVRRVRYRNRDLHDQLGDFVLQ